MPKNTKSINNKLFRMLKTHGYEPEPLDSSGKKIPVPDEADVFQFTIRIDHREDAVQARRSKDGEKPKRYEEATVTVSIDDNHELKVYYNSDASKDDNWYALLRHLKKFASRNQMGFDPVDEDQLTYDMATREHTKKESLRESEMKSGTITERYDEWDESDKWYKVIDGRLHSKFWYHAQEREARREGWSQSHEQALRRAGIIRSKRNHNQWIKMNHATGKWDTVYPYGKPDEDKKKDVEEGKFTVNAKTGAKLHPKTGAELPPKEKPLTMKQMFSEPKKHKLSLDTVWRKVEDVVGRIFPDGDPIDYLAPWLERHGIHDFKIGEILDRAAKKNGYKDLYDYYDSMKDQYARDNVAEGLNEMDSEGYKGTRDEPSKGKEHKAKAIPAKKMQSDALGTLNKAVKKQQRALKYELRFSNGRTKRITAKDDADAVRQKKGLGATSVIRLKGDVPSGKVMEGYQAAGRRASINDSVPRVKILVQHTRPIEEGEQRFRNVERIFVENTQGERILVPTTNTAMARTFARLIAEGDKPYGDRWNHLQSLCEDYSALRNFARATHGVQLNESTQRLLAECGTRGLEIRESLQRLAKHHGYHAYFENWTPTLLEAALDTGSVEQMLGESLLQDERVRSALPVLSRINSTISENASITEVDELEEWADKIIDETNDKEVPAVVNLTPDVQEPADMSLDNFRDMAKVAAKQSRDPAGTFLNDPKIAPHLFKEGMSDVDVIIQEIGSVEELNRLMNEPQGPQEEYAAQELSEKFQEIAEREGLDPEEDHDEIAEMLLDEIAGDHDQEDTPHDDGLRGDSDENVSDEESEPTVHEGSSKRAKNPPKSDQVGATEKAKPMGPILGAPEKEHPFHNQLVGANESADPDLAHIRRLSGLK